MPALSLRLECVVTIGPAPKVPSSVESGEEGRKMAQGVGLRAQTPERGMYLAFQLRNFFWDTSKKSCPLEEIFTQMRKKLDCERFLGYTSTGFESGG
jgi:hypothetical protein